MLAIGFVIFCRHHYQERSIFSVFTITPLKPQQIIIQYRWNKQTRRQPFEEVSAQLNLVTREVLTITCRLRPLGRGSSLAKNGPDSENKYIIYKHYLVLAAGGSVGNYNKSKDRDRSEIIHEIVRPNLQVIYMTVNNILEFVWSSERSVLILSKVDIPCIQFTYSGLNFVQ